MIDDLVSWCLNVTRITRSPDHHILAERYR